MLQRIRQFFLTIRLKRVILISTLTALAAMLMLVILIASLPSILSTPATQTYLRNSLTKSLKREVTWSALAVSWSRGIELKGLSLGAGPAPLVKLTMEELTVIPEVSYGQGRWRMDLSLRSRNITAEAAPGPPKPPKPYQEPLTAIAEAVQKFQKMDFPLPLDLGVKVAVEPVNLAYSDPKSGRNLRLENLAFLFDMPSLADKPIVVELRSDLSVNGHRLESLSLNADLQRLVTTARRIRPAVAVASIKATMPGSSLTLQGGLQEPGGFAARVRVHLPKVMAAYGPLLPKPMPAVQGELELDLLARVDASQDLHASMALGGSRIAVSGGRLRQGRVGPLNLRVKQKVVSDHKKQQVRFTDGVAKIDKLLEAAWEATVDHPSGKDRDLAARLGPVKVDLKQALATAGPLLPAKFPVRELAGELTLQQLSAQLQGRQKRGEVTLEKLRLTIPRFRLALARGGVLADGVDLSIDRATVPLEAGQPTRVDAALSYALRRCVLSGAQPVVAEGLQGGLQLGVTGLNLKSRSPRKVVATASLSQSLDLRRIILEQKLSVDNLHQQLIALIKAKESGEIEVTLPGLKVSAADLQASTAGKQLRSLPLTAVVTAGGIRLGAARGAPLVVDRATCTINGGDFLQLSATAALPGGSPQIATSDGTFRVDLGRFLPVAAQFLPKGAAGGGITSLTWSLAAPTAKQPLPKSRNPLAKAKAALGMVERADISLSLANRGISWPLKSGAMTIVDLHTSQPLRVVVPAKGRNITLEGVVAFAGVDGLSGSAGKLPPQSGSLSLQGELADWQSLKLHEELRAQPFGLVQKADASVSGIDRLLEKQETISAASLLQQLDAVVTADVEARFPATPTPVPGGAELSGEGSAGLRINLAAGRDLNLRATATTRDFGVKLANGTTVEGLRSDLLIDRTYALAKGKSAAWAPLSVSLVRPVPEQAAPAGATEIVTRMREDLRGQERGSRKFSVRKLVTVSGDMTLELTSLEGDLLLSREEMGLSFFQTEVLGGALRLRSMINLRPEIPALSAACSFSNLETFLLFSADARKKSTLQRQDTEITGELSLDAPLQMGQRELLEGIRMSLNLRKIGADTLERALFGLDPNERNEQIVAQRKQLRHGSLQVLRANTRDGAFSLDGDIKVKGINMALPKVERLRLSELAIQKQMAKALAGIASLRKVLDLARADTLVVGPKGKISLERRGHE